MTDIPSGHLLILSPHFDDGALSCCALLERDEPADLLTVFGGTPDPPQSGPWDLSCGFVDSTEAVAARRLEDQAAFANTPHRRAILPLLEAQYAGPNRKPSDAQSIRDAVRDWVSKAETGAIAIPAGAGARLAKRIIQRLVGRPVPQPSTGITPHADHVFVRDAAIAEVAGALKIVPLLYEEFPYSTGGPADREVQRVARLLGRRSFPFTLEPDLTAKAARLAHYQSQLPSLFPGLNVRDALPSSERYWWLYR